MMVEDRHVITYIPSYVWLRCIYSHMLHNAYCGLYMYYIYITLPDFVTMKIIFSLYYYIPIFSL